MADARDRLGKVATVVDGGQPVDLRRMTEDLHARGVDRLMVEGGGTMHTQFLTADLADELHLVVAPFFVGDSRARRFVSDGQFPWNPDRRATLAEVRQIGDVVLLRYALSPRFGSSLSRGDRCTTRCPRATVRTQVPVPLRFPDGYATTARRVLLPRTGGRPGASRVRARRLGAPRCGAAPPAVPPRWCARTASA